MMSFSIIFALLLAVGAMPGGLMYLVKSPGIIMYTPFNLTVLYLTHRVDGYSFSLNVTSCPNFNYYHHYSLLDYASSLIKPHSTYYFYKGPDIRLNWSHFDSGESKNYEYANFVNFP